ncbi:MAG: hypothetical protein ACI3VQ_05065, partial [Faecousia sp.]
PEDEPEAVEEDDLSDDIPEDVPEDEPEAVEEDDLSDDIPEDVPEDEPEAVEEDDSSDDVPEDVPEEQVETDDTATNVDSGDYAEPTEDTQDEPLDDTATEDTADDTATDVDNADSTEPTDDTQDEPLDDAATEETTDDIATDVDSGDYAEPTEDTQDEPLDDTATEDTADDTATDVDNADSTEPTDDTQDEPLDDAATEDTADDTATDVDNADSTEPTDDTQDEPLDDAATEDTADDTATDVDNGDSAEPTENTQDELSDDTATDEATEDTTSDVDSGDSAEPTENTQDELLDDAMTDETTKDTASDVDGGNSNEQIDTQPESADDTNEFNDGIQDDPSKVLKRDDLDLLKSGNDAINQRLEAQADDYRDKGMSEDEIRDRLAADKWNFQKEFLEDAFPGQDVSPNVFNGLSENGAKDRIADIENSDTLRNQLKSDEANIALDGGNSTQKWDEDEWGPDSFKPTIKDVVGEDEYKKYQDIYDTVNNLGVSDTYKDTLVDQLKNMDPELKGLYNDYANDLKCLDTNYPGVANFDRTKGGFVFSETKDVNKGLGAGNTFFHESAHMMDYLTGENGKDLSVANDLTSAIQEDYNDALSNIMKTHNCSFEEAQSKLSDELWAHPVESNCVSDVFGGLSGNKVSGPWGHRADYWAKRPRSTVGSEAFAEITADSASNPQSLEFTKKYMPKTYSAYQNMIKGVRKNG